jgi:hypothetical protein
VFSERRAGRRAINNPMRVLAGAVKHASCDDSGPRYARAMAGKK